MTRTNLPGLAILVLAALLTVPATGQMSEPSRPAENGCKWEKLSDAKVGLSAWAERCDFGDRQIHLQFKGNAVVAHYSDGGDSAALVQVFDLEDGETQEDGMRRVFEEHTDPALAGRCVPASAQYSPPPTGVTRYAFVPDAAYAAELARTATPDEVPEPPCGQFGYWPDGVQYFELQPDVRKILFVVAGQDAPLFDEQTLQLQQKPAHCTALIPSQYLIQNCHRPAICEVTP